MGAWVTVTDQLPCPRIQVLLGVTYRLLKRSGSWVVEDLHARARAFVDLDAVKTGIVFKVGTTLADSPDLARLQRVIADLVVSSQLGRPEEFLYAVITAALAEVGIAELVSTDALLLLFTPAAYGEAQARCPFQILIGHRHVLGGIHQLGQARYSLVD